MTTFKRPMLAASLMPSNEEHSDENILKALNKLRYPVLVSLKKDGIRSLRMNGSLLSRTLKPIPNRLIRERSLVLPGGFDMELWNPELSYDKIESIVMSQSHKDSAMIQFHVLDWFGKEGTYRDRCWQLSYYGKDNPNDFTIWEHPYQCSNADSLFLKFLEYEELNAEGICFRTNDSPYKQGRSTLNEQYLVKLARFARTELTIVGFKEQQENGNPDEYNDIGYMKRTTNQENMIGKDTLGSFICLHKDGYQVDVGTGVGLTDKLRKEIWNNKQDWINKQITVKFKPHGMKDKLRSPIFIGKRKEGF